VLEKMLPTGEELASAAATSLPFLWLHVAPSLRSQRGRTGTCPTTQTLPSKEPNSQLVDAPPLPASSGPEQYEAPRAPSPPSVARFPPELTAAGLEPTVLLTSGVQMRLTFS